MVLKKKAKPRKPQTLRGFFTKYIAAFCVVTILFTVLLVSAFAALLTTNVVLPANYGEAHLSAMKETIAKSENVTPDMIPRTCGYGVFTPQGRFVEGTLSKKDAATAWKLTQTQGLDHYFTYYYSVIPRKNEICIVRYSLIAQFNSPVLRRFLPPPEIFFYLIFGVGFLLEIFLLASSFGKKLTKKLRGLQHATEKIQDQDLDFSVESSGITEIDHVLNSVDRMKEALKTSLQKQWDLEQSRREQISALAHDIKTPLTVVRGNVDLLFETAQTEEQKDYTGYIADSTRQMEQYLKTLIDISKAETGYALNKKVVDTPAFLAEIHKRIAALAAAKKIRLKLEIGDSPRNFHADPDLLERAILNIASNAVDFSPENGTILFKAAGTADTIRFCVVDSGKGFSSDALKNAAQQFYMGDKSRSSKAHYGMGLFIANSIAVRHGGTLLPENSAETGGGKVTVEIPV